MNQQRVYRLIPAYGFICGLFWLTNGKRFSSRPHYIWEKYIYCDTIDQHPGDSDDDMDKELDRRDKELEALRNNFYFRRYRDE